MRKTLIFLLSSFPLLTPFSDAHATEATPLQVSRAGDLEMDCAQLVQEAILMRDIINTTEDIKNSSEIRNYGITAASALGSILISSTTGGVGLAAAGYLLKNENNEDLDAADTVQDLAQQRRSLMLGIHNAKGCYGPTEHALHTAPNDYNEPDTKKDNAISMAALEPHSGEEKKRLESAHSIIYNE